MLCDTITAAMERDAVLNIRLPVEVKDALQRAGDEDHGRSMSGMTVRILQEWLSEKGYLKAQPPTPSRKRRN